jgi:hypothetical protein
VIRFDLTKRNDADLIDGGLNFSYLHDVFEMFDAKVRHPNAPEIQSS